MRISRPSLLSALAAVLVFAVAATAQPQASKPPDGPPTSQERVTHLAMPGQPPADINLKHDILPATFGAWTAKAPLQISQDPGTADPTNAALLKEYGFIDFAAATYTRDDGRKLTIKAVRFQDASGAYGAFNFYQTPEMLSQNIGNQGFSLNNRILFFRGNVLVDAVFERLSMMSAAELRELADDLPHAPGPAGNLPTLPNYLPKRALELGTSRYILGPVGLEQAHAPLSAQLVNFGKGAEVAMGEYSINGTPSTLMLISYPTPQIAAEQTQAIDAAKQAHQLAGSEITLRRTGPLVAVLASATSERNAKSFLEQVNYDADVTWNQDTYSNSRSVGHMVLGGIMLATVLSLMTLVASIAFGGFRILMQRLFPNRFFNRPEQVELIALHLSDPVEKAGDSA